jgi:hypothetical protein
LLPALSQWHIFGIVFVLMPQLALGTFSEIMAKQSAVYAASIGKANVDDNTPPPLLICQSIISEIFISKTEAWAAGKLPRTRRENPASVSRPQLSKLLAHDHRAVAARCRLRKFC